MNLQGKKGVFTSPSMSRRSERIASTIPPVFNLYSPGRQGSMFLTSTPGCKTRYTNGRVTDDPNVIVPINLTPGDDNTSGEEKTGEPLLSFESAAEQASNLQGDHIGGQELLGCFASPQPPPQEAHTPPSSVSRRNNSVCNSSLATPRKLLASRKSKSHVFDANVSVARWNAVIETLDHKTHQREKSISLSRTGFPFTPVSSTMQMAKAKVALKMSESQTVQDITKLLLGNFQKSSNIMPQFHKAQYNNPYLKAEDDLSDEDEQDAVLTDLVKDPIMFNSHRLNAEYSHIVEKKRTATCVIYHVKDRFGFPYFIKRQLAEDEKKHDVKVETIRNEMRNEIQLLQTISHEHIVRFYSWWKENMELYLLTELCSGDSLFSYMWPDRMMDTDKAMPDEVELRRTIVPKQILNLLGQMASALTYLHGRFITHNDVKPSNIVFTSTLGLGESGEDAKLFCHKCLENACTENIQFKLCDFGRAGRIDSKKSTGDGRYMGFLHQEGDNTQIRVGRDIYALGLSAFELSGGTIPTASSQESDMLKGEGVLPQKHGLTQELVSIVESMVAQPLNARTSALDLFNHPSLIAYSQPQLAAALARGWTHGFISNSS